MTAGLAIGLGCRRGVAAESIKTLILETAGPQAEGAVLYTYAAKRDEAGLHQAAAELGLPLVFLARDALEAAMPRVLTRSTAAEARFGLASVAEAAALAGAGPGAGLLGPRLARGGVTCALARSAEVQK